MIKVSIIGSGNVAQHLVAALSAHPEIALVQVYARDASKLAKLVKIEQVITDPGKLMPADLYLIAVADQAIAPVAASLPFQNQLIAHTAGSVSIEALGTKNRPGSFYPLQTFSKEKKVQWEVVPICIEATTEADLLVLKTVAMALSQKVHEVTEQQRLALHTAAVFVCNFVNHLYMAGENICNRFHVDFSWLKPLIVETAQKVQTLSPTLAQTGPAIRADQNTINKQSELLKNSPEGMLYSILTTSIQESR